MHTGNDLNPAEVVDGGFDPAAAPKAMEHMAKTSHKSRIRSSFVSRPRPVTRAVSGRPVGLYAC